MILQVYIQTLTLVIKILWLNYHLPHGPTLLFRGHVSSNKQCGLRWPLKPSKGSIAAAIIRSYYY